MQQILLHQRRPRSSRRTAIHVLPAIQLLEIALTTIAADVRTGIMVSESRCTNGSTWVPSTKIYRIGDELIGIAGAVIDEQKWLKWHRSGRKGPRPKLEAFSALILRKGELYEADAQGLEMLIERGFHAIGSGGAAATAVMLAGHEAEEAVRIACLVDAGSGGDLQIHRL
jgi:hypothetical protein